MSPLLALAVAALLTLAQAFFVAAEFALVALRRPKIEELASQGGRRAAAVVAVLDRLSFTLSGAQFGITVTSLLVGILAEGSLAALLRGPFESLGLSPNVADGVAFAVAFVVFTVAQMVIGELAPKNLAVAKPEAVALALGPAVRGYNRLFGPIIRIFDGSANWLSRRVGVEPSVEHGSAPNLDELRRIVEASSASGSIASVQAELLRRAVQLFGGRRIAEVMVPRPDIVWLERDAPLDALREEARRTGHSRFPVRGATEDDVVGTVHIKDVLTLPAGKRPRTVGDVTQPALSVPESYELRRLLNDMRRRHRTFAVVIDEHGSTVGIVTLEDILEELVGEIEDEFDRGEPGPRRLPGGRYVAPGTMRVDRLGELLGVELERGEYDTVAGLVIARLGRIPEVGASAEEAGWRFTVRQVKGARVVELLVERIDGPTGERAVRLDA